MNKIDWAEKCKNELHPTNPTFLVEFFVGNGSSTDRLKSTSTRRSRFKFFVQ